MGLCAQADAARIYYLVGLRHVYSVPVLPDPHELDRQAIEETYAGEVQDAQKEFDKDMASIHDEEAKDGGNVHQIDRDAVQQNLEAAIADAASKRDADLTALYPQVDDVRASHPEFKVDQDGPYHVIGVDTAPTGEYVNVVYYRPYPMYYEPCPFGWGWGTPYPYATFGVQVGLFHSTWISIGAPVFAPMYYGGVFFVVNAPIRTEVIIGRSAWVGGRPPMVTAQDRAVFAQHQTALAQSHYFENARAAAQARTAMVPARSKYARTPAGGSSGSSSSAGSRYSHSTTGSTSSSRGTTTGSSASKTGPGSSKYARPATPPPARTPPAAPRKKDN